MRKSPGFTLVAILLAVYVALAHAGPAAANPELLAAVERADALIEEALALLTKLQAVEDTLERESLVGSAYKRRALVDAAGGRRTRVRADLQEMKACYQRAHAVGARSGAADVYYPASNCLAADVALNAGKLRWRGLERDIAVETTHRRLAALAPGMDILEIGRRESMRRLTIPSGRPSFTLIS